MKKNGGEIDVDWTTCFMTVEIERGLRGMFPRWVKCH